MKIKIAHHHQGNGGKDRMPMAYLYSSGNRFLQQQSQHSLFGQGQPIVEQKPNGPPVAQEQSHTCVTQVTGSSADFSYSPRNPSRSTFSAGLSISCPSATSAKDAKGSCEWNVTESLWATDTPSNPSRTTEVTITIAPAARKNQPCRADNSPGMTTPCMDSSSDKPLHSTGNVPWSFCNINSCCTSAIGAVPVQVKLTACCLQ